MNCLNESHNQTYSEIQQERVEELKSTIDQKNEEIEKLKNTIEQLNQLLNGEKQKIKQLKNKLRIETQALKETITKLTEETNTRGMTMPQQVLAFYYLFNELGISFNNSDKTQWARFINTFTGKNFQNIRTELNIDFESKKTQKNLRVVSDLFAELFPRIQQKVINDSQI
jgi:exonuclease VII large subunit